MGITEQVRLGDASIADVDPELWAAMEGERRRQHDKIELIASENYTAAAVREDTERIDYDALQAQAEEVRPKLIVAGASAYPRMFDFERMAAIAHDVGALLFVDMAHIAGLVAAGVHPSPFPHADIVTTTTHKTLRGGRGGLVFSREELPPEVDKADFPTVKTTLGAQIDKAVFPGSQGGPLLHVIAGKAVGLL